MSLPRPEAPALRRQAHDAADEYHQLGNVALLRQQFDQAEQWYRKAVEVFERLGHPPLMVDTLAQLGVLMRRQRRLDESVSWYGRALAIAAEYKMRVGGQIAGHLARVMKDMGEEAFAAAWRQAFSQDPPLDLLRKVLRRMEEDSG